MSIALLLRISIWQMKVANEAVHHRNEWEDDLPGGE